MTESYRHLPSLQAMRCFEAAARLGSFALAAEELHITQSAISHQIRSLEEGAGKPLFQRIGNRLTLTKSGRVLAVETRRALDYLSRAYGTVQRPRGNAATFTLAAQFALTEHWLLPRLPVLQSRLNGAILQLVSLADLAEELPEPVDAAIVYGEGDIPGMQVERLADELVFPVCSPDFLRDHPISDPADIARLPLLLHSHATWNLWLEKAGLPITYPRHSVFFDDVALTIRGALLGHGVAMARSRLVHDYLKERKLVRLFDLAVPGIFGYFLAWRSEALKVQNAGLRDWIFQAFTAA